MVQELINSITQLIAFSAIPFIVYLVRKKSLKGFFDDLGLKSAPLNAMFLGGFSSLLILVPPLIAASLDADTLEAFHHPESMTGRFHAMGFGLESMMLILITALIKTSLSEEIFFRGFVAKRLMSVMGAKWGNITQAIIFGAIHILIMMQISESMAFIVLMFILTTAAAWLMAFINETKANGSILPSWLMHGLGNVLAYSILAFAM